MILNRELGEAILKSWHYSKKAPCNYQTCEAIPVGGTSYRESVAVSAVFLMVFDGTDIL
jgi:hypothetical protein